jgi:tetratricopeptide (TPR) repeat protein
MSLVILFLALNQQALAGETDLFSQAEAAFRQGLALRQKRLSDPVPRSHLPPESQPDPARIHFQKAALCFEKLRGRGLANPALFRNQGNAYLLAGDLPEAILAYRRGLRLAPDDFALQELLARAREQVIYAQPGSFGRPPVEHRPPWLPRLPRNGTLLLTGLLYGCAWLASTRWWMKRQGWLLVLASATLFLSLLLALGFTLQGLEDLKEEKYPLVVIAQDGVLLRQGNSVAYPRRFDIPLNRGTEARRLFQRGDWLQVELSGGETGWVAQAVVLVDE